MLIRRQEDYSGSRIVGVATTADPIAEAEALANQIAKQTYQNATVKRKEYGDMGDALPFPHFDIESEHGWLETIFLCKN